MIDLFSVKNKTVIVTGANGGNGKAITTALKLYGANVISVDLPEYDVTNINDLDRIVSQSDTIDGLVNCAGVTYGNNLFNYTNEDWENTYKVNLKAPYELSRKVARLMKSNGGSIINITSLNAELGFPDNPAYVASKGGLKQLTKSLALDLGKYNIGKMGRT